jgi:hypothetical protein
MSVSRYIEQDEPNIEIEATPLKENNIDQEEIVTI